MSDHDKTRKIENFIPRCPPRHRVIFDTIEEALRWLSQAVTKDKRNDREAA